MVCAILHHSSTTRHQLLVSVHALRHPAPFKHDQTPIAGVWSWSATSCPVPARSDTNCWCLVMLCKFLYHSRMIRHQQLVSAHALRMLCTILHHSSMTRHQSVRALRLPALSSTTRDPRWVSGRALRLPVPFEHDQMPMIGVCSYSAPPIFPTVYTVLGRQNI